MAAACLWRPLLGLILLLSLGLIAKGGPWLRVGLAALPLLALALAVAQRALLRSRAASARSGRSARKPSGSVVKRRKRVLFNRRVGCMAVPNYLELDEPEKAAIWWMEHDYAKFREAAAVMKRAYKAAARSLGVGMPSVCSAGSHAKRAYEAMVEAHPSLKNESRRGIGLGRNFKKRKAAYISAVVQEQRRQREANMRDEDALACAAMRVSKKDRTSKSVSLSLFLSLFLALSLFLSFALSRSFSGVAFVLGSVII